MHPAAMSDANTSDAWSHPSPYSPEDDGPIEAVGVGGMVVPCTAEGVSDTGDDGDADGATLLVPLAEAETVGDGEEVGVEVGVPDGVGVLVGEGLTFPKSGST
jgi:hypothetical protein